MSDVKFQLGGEVRLFETDLVGMLDSSSQSMVIKQTNAGVDAPGISIDKFIKDIEGMFNEIGIKSFKIDLPADIKEITEGINIYLKEIFMLIKTGGRKSIDFAIWVSMDTSEKLQEKFPIAIKSGYIKVWNTEIETIKKEMDIGTIEKLLGQAPSQESLAEQTSESKNT